MSKVNPRALSDSIIHTLLEEIRSGKYQSATRLPAEDELAKELGVSRSMMRECLTELERIGMVNRHKGIGTIINRRIVNTPHRLDLIRAFDPLLADLGYESASPYARISQMPADEEIANNLEIAPGAPVLISERLITLNGTPGIYLKDYVPAASVPADSLDTWSPSDSIFSQLSSIGIETQLFLTEIRAVALPEEAAEHLELEPGSPILFLSELGFDLQSHPVLYSQEYLVDRMIHQMIVRKKI